MNDRFFLSGYQFPRPREHEILVPLSIMGVWKNIQKSIVDECASHMTLFVQALSLELAELSINCKVYIHLYFCFLDTIKTKEKKRKKGKKKRGDSDSEEV